MPTSADNQKPGYHWGHLYHRKRTSVRTALLAMKHKAETLDAVGISDVPDSVRGQQNGRVHNLSAGRNQRVQELANYLDGWLRNGAQGKRIQIIRDLELKVSHHITPSYTLMIQETWTIMDEAI
jgi:hypothetical protein